MSRGHYSGGHTIIRADGSFGSHDPAETRYTSSSTAKKIAKSPKKAEKQSKPLSLAVQRKTLLNIAADAHLSKRQTRLKCPKNIGDEVRQDVARVGTLEDWAVKQAGFDELVRKKLLKKQVKERRKNRSIAPVHVEVVRPSSRTSKKTPADRDRIAFLRSEIAQAQDFIRFAEKEIKRLQSAADQSSIQGHSDHLKER